MTALNGAFLKRKYATVAALMGLLAPTFASAQEQAGGEASLKLPDLSVVNHFGLTGPALLMIGVVLDWPLWWVSACSVLVLLILQGVAVNQSSSRDLRTRTR